MNAIGMTAEQEAYPGDAAMAKLQAAGPRHAFTPQEAAHVAKDFESVFIAQMLEHMFHDVPRDEWLGGGETDEVYHSMMLDEDGKGISQAGGIGVAAYVQRELLRLQET